MRFKITPRDATFFDLFADLAAHLVTGANLLAQLVGSEPADRGPLAEQLKDCEHLGDDATHSILRRVNQTFVTPFDRDDIYDLASALDDCMDFMEAAGEIVVLYGVDELPDAVTDQVTTLQRAAELTADAMPKLRTMTGLEEYWIEVNRLENEADKLYRALLADLFRNPRYQESPAGVVELMRLRSVIDTLEQAADSFENVANTVETIILKES
ncbi:DUF47 domain-containing protein [Pseudactinotalea sp. HY158]|uniref:DUF47 domain-containing protein n=1 Tax=unclassified Pseudactinotalea TaxID=2649176 RepID=UPI00129C11FA|nr:DUF47 family protein [Pseudactinotalea sp. HY158]MPV50429.1 DUF47 family protein [Pseudactinotalea sp. HY160]QGH70543.1 DUF47 family protein [Pseudactinotalea sp. HY158]